MVSTTPGLDTSTDGVGVVFRTRSERTADDDVTSGKRSFSQRLRPLRARKTTHRRVAVEIGPKPDRGRVVARVRFSAVLKHPV